MNVKRYSSRALLVIVLLSLLLGNLLGASSSGPPVKLDAGYLSAVGIPGDQLDVAGGDLIVEPVSQPLSGLTSADWQKAYEQARWWLHIGEKFRGREIQRLDHDQCLIEAAQWQEGDPDPEWCSFSVTGATNNYVDFNNGRLYWRFCADYDEPYVGTGFIEQAIDDPGDVLKLDAFGYGPEWADLTGTQKVARVGEDTPDLGGEKDVRNKLIDARRLFAALAVYPPAHLELTEVSFPPDATDIGEKETLDKVRARDLGKEGLLEATREMVNVHMVFGNEFMVKALRYPFGVTDTSSESIVEQEVRELERALRQYELAADTIVLALNLNLGGVTDTYIGDFFTEREFQAFAAASTQMVLALNEIARRERILGVGGDESALARLADGFVAQYLQALALADQAVRLVSDNPETSLDESRAHFLDNGGWEVLNNLERIVQQSESIRAGLNPLGYEDTFVPLTSFGSLFSQTCGSSGSGDTVACDSNAGLLGTALAAQDDLIAAQREFDQNFALLKSQLVDLQTEYDRLLQDLCGLPDVDGDGIGDVIVGPDGLQDFGDCEGGLIGQNALAMFAASRAVDLAWNRIEAISDTIASEQQLQSEVIAIDTAAGEQISLVDYNIGKLEAIRRSTTFAVSNAIEFYSGVETYADAKVGTKVSANANPIATVLGGGAEFSSSFEAGLKATAGLKLSTALLNTNQMAIDWNAQALRGLTRMKEVLAHERDMAIEHAKSETRIRELLIEQTSLLIEYELAVQDLNKAIAEHNHLVGQRRLLLNQRAGTKQDIQESYLTKPYTRFVRDTAALKAAETLDRAIQSAYLTAKAYEYFTLSPVSNMYELYRARNADNVRSFMDDLGSCYGAILNQNFSKITYLLSVAEDILGWTDEYLTATYGLTNPQEIADKRVQLFQCFLQDSHIVNPRTGVDKIAFSFETTLYLDEFLHAVANNRIAGTDDTDPGCTAGDGCRGLWLNIVTRQDLADFQGDQPAIRLTHGGHGSHRNGNLEIVEYDPGPPQMIGHRLPTGFESQGTRTTYMSSHINLAKGAEPDPNLLEDHFYFLSVATPLWILEIDLTNPWVNTALDITQLEDIELRMDTTFFTPQGTAEYEQYVAMDVRRVEAETAGQPVPEDVVQFMAAYEQEHATAQLQTLAASTSQVKTAEAIDDDTYLGLMSVTDPVDLGTWDLGFTLAFAPDGTITGNLCAECTPLYGTPMTLTGSFDTTTITPTFIVESNPIEVALSGRTATRVFTFLGEIQEDGLVLSGTCIETITGLTPRPVVSQGEFQVSRLSMPGVAPTPLTPDWRIYLPLVLKNR